MYEKVFVNIISFGLFSNVYIFVKDLLRVSLVVMHLGWPGFCNSTIMSYYQTISAKLPPARIELGRQVNT